MELLLPDINYNDHWICATVRKWSYWLWPIQLVFNSWQREHFSLRLHIQSSSGAHSVSNPISTRDSLPKVGGWRMQLTTHISLLQYTGTWTNS